MEIDNLVIGGGLLGLLTLRELNSRFPEQTNVLFEKNEFLGDLASGRNSGVLHAGIYYPTNSQKHIHCMKGKELWSDLSKELGFDILRCGKFIIATSEQQHEALENFYQKAKQNDVPHIDWASEEQVEEVREYAHVSKAFFSAGTSVLSPGAVIKSLEEEAYKKNFIILKENEVLDIKREGDSFHIISQRENLKTKRLFNCAGGFAPKLRKLLGFEDITSQWVKGNYLKLKKDFYNKSLIYPVPLPNLKGLGIHTSFDLDGIVRFGPNTEDVQNYEHSFSEQTKIEMFKGVREIFKGIELDDLEVDYCGIRPKINRDGELFSDFYLNFQDNYYELLGIESPGFTAAPSIVKTLCEQIRD